MKNKLIVSMLLAGSIAAPVMQALPGLPGMFATSMWLGGLGAYFSGTRPLMKKEADIEMKEASAFILIDNTNYVEISFNDKHTILQKQPRDMELRLMSIRQWLKLDDGSYLVHYPKYEILSKIDASCQEELGLRATETLDVDDKQYLSSGHKLCKGRGKNPVYFASVGQYAVLNNDEGVVVQRGRFEIIDAERFGKEKNQFNDENQVKLPINGVIKVSDNQYIIRKKRDVAHKTKASTYVLTGQLITLKADECVRLNSGEYVTGHYVKGKFEKHVIVAANKMPRLPLEITPMRAGTVAYAAAYGLHALQMVGRFAVHDNLAGCKNNKLFTTLLIGSAIGAGVIWAGVKGLNWAKDKSKSFKMPELPSIPEWVSKSNASMVGLGILAILPVLADIYINTRVK